jgi:putative transposase
MKKNQNLNQRIESHDIGKGHELYPMLDDLSFKAKNLYNYANYLIRQEFIFNKKWLRYRELDAILNKNQTDYKALLGQTSQQILRLLDKNWVSFFKAIKDWSRHSDKYQGRPKLPKYKAKKLGRSIVIFTNQQCKLVDGFIQFPKIFNGFKLKTNVPNIQQLRVIPCGSFYKLEVIYNVVKVPKKVFNYRICAIDLGLENFATLTNNVRLKPAVIKGGILKSINQYYNKVKSEKQSTLKTTNKKDWSNELERFTRKRNNKINYWLHIYSKKVVQYCLENEFNTLVIGHNNEWKQEINIGKINNQKFVGIPFSSFIQKMDYKCEDVGIDFIETTESYTSKASYLDSDPIPKEYDENLHPEFSGKRIKRGLYRSKDGTIINADVNGSYNIGRKVFPNEFKKSEGIVGVGLHPVRLNCLTKSFIKSLINV